MKTSHKSRIPIILLIAVLIGGALLWHHYSSGKLSIKIGVLHSLSGPMAASEKPLVDAIQLAIEEANAAGGIGGRKIEAVVADCRSDATYCAQQAERMITEEHVQALFGCWTTDCRKKVKKVVEEHRHLLFYALRYEGMEQSPNIIYGGAIPNQLGMPAVNWALENLGKEGNPEKHGKRVYLAGSDYIFSQVLSILIKDMASAHGAIVVGERYQPLGSANMDDLVADIAGKQPDIVFNTISGPDNNVFFKTLKKNGIVAAMMPVLSFGVTEVELKGAETAPMAGHYAARNYFRTIPTHENQAFVKRFRDRFGEHALLDSPAEASYLNMRMWIQAALETSSGDLHKVQRTILRQSLLAPEGIVSLDPVTRHVWKVARVGRSREDGQIDVVWDSGKPLEPAPFPTYRSREEWKHLLGPIASPQP